MRQGFGTIREARQEYRFGTMVEAAVKEKLAAIPVVLTPIKAGLNNLRAAALFDFLPTAARTGIVTPNLGAAAPKRGWQGRGSAGLEPVQGGAHFGGFVFPALFLVEMFQALIKNIRIFYPFDSFALQEEFFCSAQIASSRRSEKVAVRPADPSPTPPRILD